MATACCDRHADGTGRLALIYVDEDGGSSRTSFDELAAMSRRFANVLKADGLVRGDRVAVFLSQSLELPVAHLAAFRSGLVSIPLFALFGEDALEFRLSNSGAKAIVTDAAGWEKLAKIRDRLPDLKMSTSSATTAPAGTKSFWPALEAASDRIFDRRYRGRRSRHDHLHLGHHRQSEGRAACPSRAARPSAQCRDGARFLAKALRRDVDAGRLGLDRRIVRCAVSGLVSRRAGGRASRPEIRAAGGDAADGRSRRAQRVPAADRAEADAAGGGQAFRREAAQHLSGGESLGAELLEWVRATFGIDAHEVYGQTECNLVVGNNSKLFPIRPGSMGKATPGFDVRIVNEHGEELPRGEPRHHRRAPAESRAP